jgi:TonB family protein
MGIIEIFVETLLTQTCKQIRYYFLIIKYNIMKSKILSTKRISKKITKRQLGIFLFFWFFTGVNIGQPNTIDNPTFETEIDTNNLSIENTDELSSKDFFDTYNIDNTNSFNGKLLNESVIRITPSCSADLHKITLPAGEIVQVYKYLEKKDGGCWAIRYNGHYGFIKNTELMPISNKTSTERIANEYDTPPKLITLIRPKYPKEARKKNIKGSVIVKAYINSAGKVEDVKISKGIEGLNQSALEAVEKARFKPAKNKKTPVSTWISLSIDFE